MAEEKTKKLKVYQIAKDLNISHDTVLEFLKEKGHNVKTHMSPVNDEMMNDIMVRFRKDRDIVATHKKKLREFKEKYRKHELEEETKISLDKKKEEITEIAAEKTIAVEEKATQKVAPEFIIEDQIGEAPIISAEKVSEEISAAGEVMEQVRIPEVVSTAYDEKKEVKEISEEKVETIQPVVSVQKQIPKPERIEHKTQRAIQPGGPQKHEVPLKGEEVEKVKKRKRKKKKKDEISLDKGFDFEEFVPKKKKKSRLKESNEQDVEDAIKRTFAEMDEAPVRGRAFFKKRKKKERLEEQIKEQELIEKNSTIIRVTEYTSVNELANIMQVSVTEVIQKCIDLGLMVSINQRLDNDTIILVADEFGYQVEFQQEYTSDKLADFEDPPETLKQRAPVITIMGHVDHGKTSLLDFIRNTNVVAGEAGGITQHIGAYKVSLENNKEITFIDTPGHEAFTSMRARGAKITDIVVLVVAADDSVMPQTIEAISHAQAANVTIIVAINKIDKPNSNVERIKQQLSEKGVLVEEWGGKYQSIEISAKYGTNVKELLEKILLEAEILDLKSNPDRTARGVVLEAELDKGKGIIATILVQKGTLKIGDPFIAGVHSGKVRAMLDERGNRVEAAGPSTPIQVLGFDGIPQAGDEFIALENERETKDISSQRQQLKREQEFRQMHLITLDDISRQIKDGETKELNIIVKGDVDGSVEALADSLMKLANKEVKVRVIHKGVGNISEPDILLASASKAIIIGFHIRPNLTARKLAEKESVEIRSYNIIYDAINDVKSALEGMLNPEITEEILSTVEIRDIFKVPKIGTIAGCYVQEGKITRNSKVRLIRDGITIHQGNISSLKRFKDDVKEVDSGFECGLGLENYNDVKVGDVVESFKLVEKKRKLQLDRV